MLSFRRFLLPALCLAVLPAARAMPGDLDPLDLNIVGGTNYTSFVITMAVQPDGKSPHRRQVCVGPRGGAQLHRPAQQQRNARYQL